MDNPWASLLVSELFTFVVGEEKKPVVVHSAALAQISPVLNALMSGRMAEAKTRSAELDDVGVDDFVRFCQFAYIGDYSTPKWETVQNTEVEKRTDKSRHSNSSNTYKGDAAEEYIVRKKSKKAKSELEDYSDGDYGNRRRDSKRVARRQKFAERTFCKESPGKALMDSFEASANSSSTQDFAPVLLGHARLYVLADKYCVDSLKQLALQKLHTTLKGFTLYRSRTQDIVELVRYAYNNDHTSDSVKDPLRKLVSEFVVCEVDTIGTEGVFVSLLEEGGPFVGDFWTMVAKDFF